MCLVILIDHIFILSSDRIIAPLLVQWVPAEAGE